MGETLSLVSMAGSRSLTCTEERSLIRGLRKLSARDRALIATQAFTGFRISEVLSLTIGQIFRNGRIVEKLGVRPKHLKGHYGNTRWVPIGPELRRALETYLTCRARKEELNPALPLFLSREHGEGGAAKALSRSGAEKLIRRVLRSIAECDGQRLSSHSLRKSWARRLYEKSGHNMLMVRDGLGHSSVAITEMYLSVNRDELEETIKASDWTRGSKKKTKAPVIERPASATITAKPTSASHVIEVLAAKPAPLPSPAAIVEKTKIPAIVSIPTTTPSVVGSAKKTPVVTLCLPGFEDFAA
jgi:hypothetical protein